MLCSNWNRSQNERFFCIFRGFSANTAYANAVKKTVRFAPALFDNLKKSSNDYKKEQDTKHGILLQKRKRPL